ncbi:AmmeMemoRadiSam system radical SAM enzyme [Natranaerobius thermophilus]|uniref:Radical SAM domain protein n=1 Tax=Natranaerobius thermophilus (strain ATCC BAA-1301 / DSM 18059 / JW/NM-WN-LF) TaxID=457570 RepID=B2A4R6_NATTJ|nr:AmmeMemoRadiSam system radical SAM enzyme [Natranaerobius thermophilus]ACB83838.1 Radical SAM domain protein [Natranaerobius thermophilus JW/NM-WN-LF]
MKLPHNLFRDKKGEFVNCHLCFRRCLLKEGELGFCGNRKAVKNLQGELQPVFRTVKRIEALNIDPIEKKPLYHFYPGKNVISLGLRGCNMKCFYCQNYQLSQDKNFDFKEVGEIKKDLEIEKEENPPLVEQTKSLLKESGEKQSSGAIGVAFTYSEPITWFEFLYPVAKNTKKEGFVNVLVSNGMVTEEVRSELSPLLDGANIDVKSFSEENYRHLGGSLTAVKSTVEDLHASGIHVELTYLIVPEFNDKDQEIKSFLKWVSEVSPDIPVHFSRYFPSYQAQASPTPVEKMIEVYNIAKQYINYVYLGNLGQEKYQSTYCPECEGVVIRRSVFAVSNKLKGDECPYCQYKIAGCFIYY